MAHAKYDGQYATLKCGRDAALISAQLQLGRARAAAETLNVTRQPAAALRDPGQVYVANSLFESLLSTVARDSRERLKLSDRSADALLATALPDAKSETEDGSGTCESSWVAVAACSCMEGNIHAPH